MHSTPAPESLTRQVSKSLPAGGSGERKNLLRRAKIRRESRAEPISAPPTFCYDGGGGWRPLCQPLLLQRN